MTDRLTVMIRRYHAGDHEAVISLSSRLTIGVAGWRDSAKVATAVRNWVQDSLASAHQENHAVFVAEVDRRVVGIVTLGERGHFTGETDGYIGELITAEDHEGEGVGTALLDAAEEWTRRHGHPFVTLETGAHNAHALSFYRLRGYVDEDVRLTKNVGSPHSERQVSGRPDGAAGPRER